ncbi:MAG: glycosyltransferase family 4 protein [Deltaproteobacteria bacterium]|nr:glycosyltransferase family 4 protein [Deltaproteobacteria bacterium]
MSRKLAFCLIKYFPYGGLQRDFLKIAEICHRSGYRIEAFTLEWTGPVPEWLTLRLVRVRCVTNHARRLALSQELSRMTSAGEYAATVGFSKMPGLDVYFAADSCYAAKNEKRNIFYRLSGRYRVYSFLEKAVFSAASPSVVLMLSEAEKHLYQHFYQTPEERLFLLPPGISRDRLRPLDAAALGAGLRAELGVGADSYLVLLVGSGFKTKGVDRALLAVASLPEEIRENCFLVVIGKDNFSPFARLAKSLGIAGRVIFFPGRDDITRFLVAADLLIHPAYKENTGTVLIEALAAGLPVLTTDVCGYSGHIRQAQAGLVLASPFLQERLNLLLARMLLSRYRKTWSRNALRYVEQEDVFSMPEKAAEIIIKVARRQKP